MVVDSFIGSLQGQTNDKIAKASNLIDVKKAAHLTMPFILCCREKVIQAEEKKTKNLDCYL